MAKFSRMHDHYKIQTKLLKYISLLKKKVNGIFFKSGSVLGFTYGKFLLKMYFAQRITSKYCKNTWSFWEGWEILR